MESVWARHCANGRRMAKSKACPEKLAVYFRSPTSTTCHAESNTIRIYFSCCNARPRCCRQNAVCYRQRAEFSCANPACKTALLRAKCGLLLAACGVQLRKYCMQDRAACMRNESLLHAAVSIARCERKLHCGAKLRRGVKRGFIW